MTTSTDNPLLDLPFAVPFDRIEAAHVQPAIEALLARAEGALEAIRRQEGTPTWASTLGALDRAQEPLERAWGVVEHLRSVRHAEELDTAHAAVLPKVSAFFAGIPLDDALYAALVAFAATPEAEALTGPRRRLLDRTLASFRRAGADLQPEAKARYAAIVGELDTLAARFASHVVQETSAWTLDLQDEARLEGLPESARASLAQAARQAGVPGWRVTLQAPHVTAVLSHARDRALREQVWRAYQGRCVAGPRANGEILQRMLALRREQAGLVGFADFADFILSDRMAGSGHAAQAFLDDVEARVRPAADRETAELRAYAAERLQLPELAPWDVGFAAEQLRKERFDLDDEDLRPYFALDRVLDGVWALLGRLYGVSVRAASMPVWHPDVRSWELLEADGTLLGAFYTDFHPRNDKRGGAWMNGLITGGPRADGFAPHLGLVCGNLTPPADDRPALLTHREVETVFHEVGHLVHLLLSTVELRPQAGTNVAWDFVELPSQILENWASEREGLALFATHWQTGAPLPDALFERMTAARTFRQGSFFLRQLGFGQTDLALHRRWDAERDGDAVAWGTALMDRYAATPSPAGASMLPAFLHLFSDRTGYAAGYYSYLWAAVLDADAFGRFREAGIFDRTTGQSFRREILSKGDSAPPEELFRAFMGRDPDPEALLKRAGIAA
ncbi:MAG: M3 family metallopeptidase [Alphaproteobacteria bacterium]|nr:M3 family metallopeptidase [Alphaproteobacteria bacterium]